MPVFEKESNQPHLYKNLFTGSTVWIHPVEYVGYNVFFSFYGRVALDFSLCNIFMAE